MKANYGLSAPLINNKKGLSMKKFHVNPISLGNNFVPNFPKIIIFRTDKPNKKNIKMINKNKNMTVRLISYNVLAVHFNKKILRKYIKKIAIISI